MGEGLLPPYSGISSHVPKECVVQKKSPVIIFTLGTLGKEGNTTRDHCVLSQAEPLLHSSHCILETLAGT